MNLRTGATGEPGKPGTLERGGAGGPGGRGGTGGPGGGTGGPGGPGGPGGNWTRLRRWWWLRPGLLAYLCCFAAVGLLAWQAFSLRHEIRDRRDQTCHSLERQHRDDVNLLWAQYRFLNDPPQPVGRFAVTQVLVLTRQLDNLARHDPAPDYCDEPGMGEPEPDPPLPQRKDFSYLLRGLPRR